MDKQATIDLLTSAFDGLRLPPGDYGIHAAEARDNFRDPTPAEIKLDQGLDWPDVTIEQLANCPSALSHLSPAGYHHYFPAFAILSMRYEDDKRYNGYAFMDSAEYSLFPGKGGLATYVEERHARFDTAQTRAIIAYLSYRRDRYKFVSKDVIDYWQDRLAALG